MNGLIDRKGMDLLIYWIVTRQKNEKKYSNSNENIVRKTDKTICLLSYHPHPPVSEQSGDLCPNFKYKKPLP